MYAGKNKKRKIIKNRLFFIFFSHKLIVITSYSIHYTKLYDTMGRVEQDVMYHNDNYPRRVTVASFYMDETEVSNQDYRVV